MTLLGLAAKNAILIVEYASLKARGGYSTSAAAIEAARLALPADPDDLARVHPRRAAARVLDGAGAGARHSVGTGVMGGMLAATFLAIFFVPLFFKLITERKLREDAQRRRAARRSRRRRAAQRRASSTARRRSGNARPRGQREKVDDSSEAHEGGE